MPGINDTMGNNNPSQMQKSRAKSSNKEEEVRINRRNLLIGTTSAGLFSSASVVSASSIDSDSDDEISYTKREQQVIRIKVSSEIESPSAGKVRMTTGDAMTPGYFISDGKAFNVSPDNFSLFEKSKTITTPVKLIGTSQDSTRITVPDLAKSGFEGFAIDNFQIVDGNGIHDLRLVFDGTEVVVYKKSKVILSVKPDQSKSVDLKSKQALTKIYEEREMENPREKGDSTVTRKFPVEEGSTLVTPKITVKNEGRIPVLGKSDGLVFPEDMPNARIIKGNARKSEKYEVKQSSKGIITIKEVGQ